MKNQIIQSFKKLLFLFTITSFLSLSIQSPAMASMVSSSELNADSQVELKRDEIRALTAREDVKSYLYENGVNASDLDSRIDAMTDSEVLSFHADMDDLPAGEGVLGAVIAIIVIFMLLDMAGVTDIFPNI